MKYAEEADFIEAAQYARSLTLAQQIYYGSGKKCAAVIQLRRETGMELRLAKNVVEYLRLNPDEYIESVGMTVQEYERANKPETKESPMKITRNNNEITLNYKSLRGTPMVGQIHTEKVDELGTEISVHATVPETELSSLMGALQKVQDQIMDEKVSAMLGGTDGTVEVQVDSKTYSLTGQHAYQYAQGDRIKAIKRARTDLNITLREAMNVVKAVRKLFMNAKPTE